MKIVFFIFAVLLALPADFKLYKNGSLVNTTTDAIALASSSNLRFGGSGGAWFTGKLSKFGVYNARAITLEEVGTLYANP